MPASPLEEMPGDIKLARLNIKSLGESNIESVRTHLLDLVERQREQNLHLDLSPLGYMISSGLDLFLSLDKQVRAAGGRLRLYNVADPLYELFTITRLDAILDVHREGPHGTSA
jgi:anti-sigma B factor antagonist